jgi:hypothetical protein
MRRQQKQDEGETGTSICLEGRYLVFHRSHAAKPLKIGASRATQLYDINEADTRWIVCPAIRSETRKPVSEHTPRHGLLDTLTALTLAFRGAYPQVSIRCSGLFPCRTGELSFHRFSMTARAPRWPRADLTCSMTAKDGARPNTKNLVSGAADSWAMAGQAT